VRFGPFPLTLLPGVFNPTYGEGARLFLANEHEIYGRRAWDVGTGSGALAILAAQHCDFVVATDVEPVAVTCADQNVQRLDLQNRVGVRQGDLFEPLRQTDKFDLVLSNLPFLNGPATNSIERAMYDEGYRNLGRFLEGVGRVITPTGRILLCFSTAGDLSFLLWQLRSLQFVFQIKDRLVENDFDFFLFEIHRPLQSPS
jgi:methylase of polypeptide subunit release factors